MKEVLRAAGIPCARHALVRHARQALRSPGGRVPAGRQAAGRCRGAGDLPARRRRRPRGWLHAVPPSAGRPGAARGVPRRRGAHLRQRHDRRRRPCGRRSPTTGRRRSRCCATRGSSGRCCCHATSPGRRTPASTASVPPPSRALGVTDALTHMEWFRRPDGSVAVSEVAARPPGAQLTSMLGYAHDFDLFRAWAELVVLDRFAPPSRQYAAGTAYLRGQGHGRVAGRPRARGRAARPRPPRGGGEAAAAGPAGEPRLHRRGLRDPPGPGHRVVDDGPARIVSEVRVELVEAWT